MTLLLFVIVTIANFIAVSLLLILAIIILICQSYKCLKKEMMGKLILYYLPVLVMTRNMIIEKKYM